MLSKSFREQDILEVKKMKLTNDPRMALLEEHAEMCRISGLMKPTPNYT
jgi:hypothetical protein